MQARLEAMEMARDKDVGDVSEPEVGAVEEEELADVTPEMRFFKSVLISTLNLDLKFQFIQEA